MKADLCVPHMVFSSTIFLFVFLPLVLLSYLVVSRKFRNLLLLTASLIFYAWGENIYVLLMLVSIALNYSFGLLIDRAKQRGWSARVPLGCALVANLGLLGFFKYANFLVDNLNTVLVNIDLATVELQTVHLPIGISFFTFQALSYVVDVYRGHASVQKNPVHVALYISLFPQLIAGPIVRYHDVAEQIVRRMTRFDDFAYGIRRFIIGLGKKVLVANVLGRTADYIFSLPAETIPAGLAWIGAISYTLQIYYDFSGYSDMAIGLGRMFGFRFLENFNYPYAAQSMREFWRRWHISLSSWFRDYLYIPLGGNRHGGLRTHFNLLIVFFLCGLWHGASWTFVVWGLYHGGFLVLERLRPINTVLEALPRVLRHAYVVLAVVVGWVFFRAETFSYAIGYLQAMVTFITPPFYNSQLFLIINNEFWLTLVVAIICSAPVMRGLARTYSILEGKAVSSGMIYGYVLSIGAVVFFGFVLSYSVASLMGGAYNPFLYFRF
ncbi:MAG: MBOAT family protein [Desulfobulbaceae bacterium]|nr:MBOAT family protein [Desulfobulbaceae bacterium]